MIRKIAGAPWRSLLRHYEISVGALARFGLGRAEAEVGIRRQHVVISQETVEQREIAVKQVLRHVENPALE